MDNGHYMKLFIGKQSCIDCMYVYRSELDHSIQFLSKYEYMYIKFFIKMLNDTNQYGGAEETEQQINS